MQFNNGSLEIDGQCAVESVSGLYEPARPPLGTGRGKINLPPAATSEKVYHAILNGHDVRLKIPGVAKLIVSLQDDGSFTVGTILEDLSGK